MLCLPAPSWPGFPCSGKRRWKTIFIPNAIDCRAFDYNQEVREKIRQELGLAGQYVIGHVGSFRYAKNHEYLLRIFAGLCEKKKDCALLLLGEGSEMEGIRRLAKELGIDKQVYFLGKIPYYSCKHLLQEVIDHEF